MATLSEPGDQLRAEKVAIEAMEIGKPKVFSRTSTHRGQTTVAERNVLCVILKKMVVAR